MDFFFNRYYALELCTASLDKLFLSNEDNKKYRGPAPPAIEILFQLASGLKYIHENKLVHSDLQPKNAFIWEDKCDKSKTVMKWADFGLNKQMRRKESRWLAPEIRIGMELKRPQGTFKSDIFAEGLTFAYILLEGEHVYEKDIADNGSNMNKNNAINLKSKVFSYQLLTSIVE